MHLDATSMVFVLVDGLTLHNELPLMDLMLNQYILIPHGEQSSSLVVV